MINNEVLYEKFVDKKQLTTKELNSIGLHPSEITTLIKNNIIKRVERGKYELLDIEPFCLYSKKIINENPDTAVKIWKRCIEIDPTYMPVYFMLFRHSIYNSDYNEAYKYLKILRNNESKYIKDYNIYLYLLSHIIKLSDCDIEYARKLEIDDVFITEDDERFSDRDKQNNARYYILESKFSIARHYAYNYIYNKLFDEIYVKQDKLKDKIKELIKDNNIEGIIDLLNNENKKHRLSTLDDAILEICNSILYMRDNDKIPELVDYKTSFRDVYSFIYMKDYKAALKFQQKVLKSYEQSQDDSILYMILEIAIKEQNRITKQEKERIKNINYVSLANKLLEGNYDEYYADLESFLKLRGKEQYKFIFVNLIKISLLEKDDLYILPMEYLREVQKEDFSFDLGLFLESFYEKMKNNNFAIAKLYLDIIKKLNEVSTDTINITILEEQLIKRQNEKIKKEIEIPKENDIVPIKESEAQKDSGNTSQIIKPRKVNNIISKEDEKKENALKYLNQKLNTLSVMEPIVLLNPMSDDIGTYIIEEINSNPNVIGMELEIDSEKRILLKHHEESEICPNYKSLYAEANNLFNERKYKKCLCLYKNIISKSSTIKSFTTAYMASIYLRFGEIDKAIMYYQISDAIDKQNGKTKNKHADIIFNLKGNIPKDETKDTRGINIGEHEFYDDMNDHYQIEEYEDIFALIEQGLTIEEACNQFNLTDEDINIIKLVTARNYYSQRNFKVGDKMFKQVEQAKNKTPFIKSLMDEIKTNKKLYPYRNSAKQMIKK